MAAMELYQTLYVIRHGLAGERGTYANDNERPLTQEGVQKTERVAQRLAELDLKFDLMLTSPLVRAKQTAKILKDYKLSSKLEESIDLAPGGSFESWIRWWESWRQNEPRSDRSSLAIVGHEPDLGEWTERLVWGEVKQRLVVKKAGVIGILLPESGSPVGNSQLFWLTPPKFLL